MLFDLMLLNLNSAPRGRFTSRRTSRESKALIKLYSALYFPNRFSCQKSRIPLARVAAYAALKWMIQLSPSIQRDITSRLDLLGSESSIRCSAPEGFYEEP